MHEFRSSILSGEAKSATPIARKAKKGGGASTSGLTKIAIKRQEARVTDQRLEDRHFGLVERTIIHFRRRKHEVAVVNVSSRGAMIESELEPRIGERIDIEFANPNRTKSVVRWVRDGRIGVEFTEETIFWDATRRDGPVFHAAREPEPEEVQPPREVVDRQPRQKLLRAGTLYWSGISIPVRLRNISAGGAQLDSERTFCPGSMVELDLGDGFQIAEVRWAKDGQVGLRFADRFDLDSLAPATLSTERPPEVLKPAYLETETRPDSPWAARFERLSMTDLRMIDPRD